MLPGYNTNGFAHHRLEDALKILAVLGYRSVALTIDYNALEPPPPDDRPLGAVLGTLKLPGTINHPQTDAVREILKRKKMKCVIETGARFIICPWRKHQPTLLDPFHKERERRMVFLSEAMATATCLGASAVSLWSGKAPEGEPEAVLWDRLVESCVCLCKLAQLYNVRLAFEPEPGMFIDTMPKFEELHRRVNHPRFGLTLDVGHLQCMGEMPSRPHVERWKDVLWNIHIEDMRRGVHDHLPFGEGEIDFGEVFAALRDVGYSGGLHVELSRHSHDAVETARRSLEFLRRYLD